MRIQNTPFGSNPFKRGVAIIIAALFLFTGLFNTAPAAFAQSTTNIQVPGGNPSGLHRLDRDREIRIPPELGKIDESFHGTSGKTILYIQDAHDSLEAQENIAKIINHLVSNYGAKTVFEEGYEGPVPTDKYFGFIKDPKIREKVSWFFMDHLRLGGAEYAHINRTKDFGLVGADSLKLHKENIEQYRLSAEKKDAVTWDLKALEKELKSLADSRFPKELKEWLKTKEQFDAKKLDLFTYLERAMALFPGSTPGVKSRGAEIKHRVLSGVAVPLLRFVLEAVKSNDPAVIEKAKRIDAREIFGELIKLDQAVAETHLNNVADKQLFEYYKTLGLLNRLNDLQVSQEEYEAVKASLKAFDTDSFAKFIFSQAPKTLILSRMWERNIKESIRFYEIAQERDHSISEVFGHYSSGDKGQKEDPNMSVLVFGGFHKESIKRILEAQGISYLVVSPHISKPSPRHEQFYKRLMTDGKLSFELSANIRIAVRAECRIVDWNANSDLARAEFRTLIPIAENISNREDFSRTAEQAMKAFRSEMRDPVVPVTSNPEAEDLDIVARIHREREIDRARIKEKHLELHEKYLPLAEEVILLAREINAFTGLTDKVSQIAIMKELENAGGERSVEGNHLARLYRSALNLTGNTKLALVPRKKAPLLLAIEYLRDRGDLYPELSAQIQIFAQEKFNLIQALSNIGKDEALSFRYEDLDEFCAFVQGLFRMAEENPQERRLLEGKEAVSKVLQLAAQFQLPLGDAGLSAARKAVFGIDSAGMKEKFGAMRADMESYQQSLPPESKDYQMAHTAELIIFALLKGRDHCTGRDFTNLVEDAGKYTGIQVKAHGPEVDGGTAAGDWNSFWEDLFKGAGVGEQWQEFKQQQAEQRAAEAAYQRRERDAESEYNRKKKSAAEVAAEIARVRQMIAAQGFVPYEPEDGHKRREWEPVGRGEVGERGVRFPSRSFHAPWHPDARYSLNRTMFGVPGVDEPDQFFIDLYEANPWSDYGADALGPGYSVVISHKDNIEHAKKSWYYYAHTSDEVFSLEFGDSFVYDREKGEMTLASRGIRVTMDRKKNLKMKSLKAGDIESLRSYPHRMDGIGRDGEHKMSLELYNMLGQYASTSQITIYGSKRFPFQFALIDDPYNDRQLIVNHKGVVIYASTEEGAVERSSLSHLGGENSFSDKDKGRLHGKREDGTEFVLNRYGIEKDERVTERRILKDEWTPHHTAILVEVFDRFLALYKSSGYKLGGISEKLEDVFKRQYPNLEGAGIEDIVNRCFEIWREMEEAKQSLEEIFKTKERRSMKLDDHYYMINDHRWQLRFGHSYGVESKMGINTAGGVENALETLHVRHDYYGSPDDSDQTLTSFEFYLNPQGQLKVRFVRSLEDILTYTRRLYPIDEAKMTEFYSKYAASALALRNPSGNSRSEARFFEPGEWPEVMTDAEVRQKYGWFEGRGSYLSRSGTESLSILALLDLERARSGHKPKVLDWWRQTVDGIYDEVRRQRRGTLARSDFKILETGIGSGILLSELAPGQAEEGYSVMGFDYDPEFVKASRRRNASKRVTIEQGDATDLDGYGPFSGVEDETIDLYVMNENLGHLPIASVQAETKAAADHRVVRPVFHEAFRKLRPGGFLVINDHPEHPSKLTVQYNTGYITYSIQDRIEALRKAGFEIIPINDKIPTEVSAELGMPYFHAIIAQKPFRSEMRGVYEQLGLNREELLKMPLQAALAELKKVFKRQATLLMPDFLIARGELDRGDALRFKQASDRWRLILEAHEAVKKDLEHPATETDFADASGPAADFWDLLRKMAEQFQSANKQNSMDHFLRGLAYDAEMKRHDRTFWERINGRTSQEKREGFWDRYVVRQVSQALPTGLVKDYRDTIAKVLVGIMEDPTQVAKKLRAALQDKNAREWYRQDDFSDPYETGQFMKKFDSTLKMIEERFRVMRPLVARLKKMKGGEGLRLGTMESYVLATALQDLLNKIVKEDLCDQLFDGPAALVDYLEAQGVPFVSPAEAEAVFEVYLEEHPERLARNSHGQYQVQWYSISAAQAGDRIVSPGVAAGSRALVVRDPGPAAASTGMSVASYRLPRFASPYGPSRKVVELTRSVSGEGLVAQYELRPAEYPGEEKDSFSLLEETGWQRPGAYSDGVKIQIKKVPVKRAHRNPYIDPDRPMGEYLYSQEKRGNARITLEVVEDARIAERGDILVILLDDMLRRVFGGNLDSRVADLTISYRMPGSSPSGENYLRDVSFRQVLQRLDIIKGHPGADPEHEFVAFDGDLPSKNGPSQERGPVKAKRKSRSEARELKPVNGRPHRGLEENSRRVGGKVISPAFSWPNGQPGVVRKALNASPELRKAARSSKATIVRPEEIQRLKQDVIAVVRQSEIDALSPEMFKELLELAWSNNPVHFPGWKPGDKPRLHLFVPDTNAQDAGARVCELAEQGAVYYRFSELPQSEKIPVVGFSDMEHDTLSEFKKGIPELAERMKGAAFGLNHPGDFGLGIWYVIGGVPADGLSKNPHDFLFDPTGYWSAQVLAVLQGYTVISTSA